MIKNNKINEKVKTTILLNKTIKKLAQVYAVQNDTTLGELIEEALEQKIVGK
jgi:hypothetical protein